MKNELSTNFAPPCPVMLARAATLVDSSLEPHSVYWVYDIRGDQAVLGLPSQPSKRFTVPVGLLLPLAKADLSALRTVPVTNNGDHGPRKLPVTAPSGLSLNELELPHTLRAQLEHIRLVLSEQGARILEQARGLGTLVEPSRLFVLCGPSGVGKTSTVAALCAELGMRLVRMGGLQTGSSYHNVAEQAMRDLLATAHHADGKLAVLLDDGDSLVRTRFGSASNRHIDNEVAALIQSLELFPRAPVFVTTNAEPDEIDAAILSRSERVVFPAASAEQRIALARRLVRAEALASVDTFDCLGPAPLSLRDVAQLLSRVLLRVAARSEDSRLVARCDVEAELATFGLESKVRRAAGFVVS